MRKKRFNLYRFFANETTKTRLKKDKEKIFIQFEFLKWFYEVFYKII